MFTTIATFLAKMVSSSGEVSFGRCSATVWSLFYLTQHAWFWHRTGALVDNATVLTHLGVITTLYGLGKIPATLGGNKS